MNAAFITIGCLLGCTGAALSSDAVAPDANVRTDAIVIRAEPLPKVPDIDGVLEDAWAKAGRADHFLDNWKGTPATVPTRAWIGLHGDNLCIAFHCDEPDPGPLVANVREHDGALWADDCVEVFLDVNHDEIHYAHFAVNALGTRSDEACTEGSMGLISNNVAWNPAWKAAVRRGASNWTVELSIPLSELKPGVLSTCDWGINLCRMRQKTATRGAAEISAISPTRRSLHAPRHFATLRIPYDWLKYAKPDLDEKKMKASKDLAELQEQLSNLQMQPSAAGELRGRIEAIRARLDGFCKAINEIGTDDARRTHLVADVVSTLASIADLRNEIERRRKPLAETSHEGQPPPLWDSAQPLPRLDDISYPAGISYHYVHRAIPGEYQYLLGPAVVFHKGKLVVTWENRKISEQSPNGIMRVSMSGDDGATWSAPQVLAGGEKGQDYGYGCLLSLEGQLWAFAARYQEGEPGVWFHGLRAEAFRLNEDTGKWETRGIVAENFLPLEAPKPQANGNWILGGEDRDAHSAVAIIPKDSFLKWKVVPIPFPGGGKDFEPQFSVIPDRNEVLAIVRNSPDAKFARMAFSRDFGEAWSPILESNWMMTDAKSYAGILSTDQRFLVSNVPNRENLMLAVSRPGAQSLSRVFKIREGRSVQPLYPGNPKKPQWSYPYATEHDGKLYIAYDVGKEDLEMAIVPVPAVQREAQR